MMTTAAFHDKENPMAVSVNSLKLLVLFKVFQFVLHTRKIIAKLWNN